MNPHRPLSRSGCGLSIGGDEGMSKVKLQVTLDDGSSIDCDVVLEPGETFHEGEELLLKAESEGSVSVLRPVERRHGNA